jgi:heme/copper-type cytochrome/quinol oxidase subunit 2
MPVENRKIIGMAVVAAVIVIAAFVFFVPPGDIVSRSGNGNKEGENLFKGTSTLPTVEGGTRTEVDGNIPTPGVNGTSFVPGVAIPTEVIPGGGISARTFLIRGENGKFVPATIVVNELDVINLSFEAVDASYTMYIPDFAVMLSAEKGKTAKAQFQATQFGQYGFVCNECGNDMKGMLIVNKK